MNQLLTDETFDITWEIPNIFSAGDYSVSVACCNASATEFYDWLNNAATFSIHKKDSTSGLIDPAVKLINHKIQGR